MIRLEFNIHDVDDLLELVNMILELKEMIGDAD